MKVLIADKFQDQGLEIFNQQFHCHYDPALKDQSLARAILEQQPEILIVRSTKVREEAMASAGSLQLIVRAGAGVDNIDLSCASKNGIYVANCPGKNAIAVAELTMALILTCDRRLPEQWSDLQQNRWNKKHYAKARGLYGLTLGLIGFGQIAREVAKRAQAFGLSVVAWSPSLDQATAKQHKIRALKTATDVAKCAEIVSVHIAANAQTRRFIGAEFFANMAANSFFINTSRGSIVDEQALIEAIKTKSIRAGLDVFEDEPSSSPSEWQKPLCQLPCVYASHHIGASTDQAQKAIADETLKICQNFAASGQVLNCLNQQRVQREKR